MIRRLMPIFISLGICICVAAAGFAFQTYLSNQKNAMHVMDEKTMMETDLDKSAQIRNLEISSHGYVVPSDVMSADIKRIMSSIGSEATDSFAAALQAVLQSHDTSSVSCVLMSADESNRGYLVTLTSDLAKRVVLVGVEGDVWTVYSSYDVSEVSADAKTKQ